jgi:hypothetical protein
MKLPLWLKDSTGRLNESQKRGLSRFDGRWSRLTLQPLEDRVLLDAAGEHFIDSGLPRPAASPGAAHGPGGIVKVWD